MPLMSKARKPTADSDQRPREAAAERARAHYQRLLRHPAPEFLAAWEYWSAELRITAGDLTRLQQQAGIPVKRRIGVTTLRRWIRGQNTPNLAVLDKLTRVLLGDQAHWHNDFIARGLRVLEDLRFYDELETR